MARILFIGDIVGKPGRSLLKRRLPDWKTALRADLVIANGENAAGGAGLTAEISRELQAAGVDGLTLGDHVWDQRGFETEIVQLERVCRPYNLPARCPGRDHLILSNADGSFTLGVATLLGRQFMNLVKAECPFLAADRLLAQLAGRCSAIFVEIHAEATSEKTALGWYLNGRVAAVIGTHTHIPTADAAILARGTAYLTDAGMTGPYASVLGREIQPVVARFIDGLPRRFEVAEGDVRLSGCVVEINPNGLATAIEPIHWKEDSAP